MIIDNQYFPLSGRFDGSYSFQELWNKASGQNDIYTTRQEGRHTVAYYLDQRSHPQGVVKTVVKFHNAADISGAFCIR